MFRDGKGWESQEDITEKGYDPVLSEADLKSIAEYRKKRESAAKVFAQFDPYTQLHLGMSVEQARAALKGISFGTVLVSVDDGPPHAGENPLLCNADTGIPGAAECIGQLYHNPLGSSLLLNFYRNRLFYIMGACYLSEIKCRNLSDSFTKQTGTKSRPGCGPTLSKFRDERVSWHYKQARSAYQM